MVFVSSNAAVVSVDNTAVEAAADGTVTATLYAHGEGNAVITAMTDNGIATVITVTAKQAEAVEPEPEVTPEPTPDAQPTPETSESEVAPAPDTSDDEEKEPAGQTTGADSKPAKGMGTMEMILLIVGIVALGAVVFVVVLKVASGPAPNK